LALFLVDIRALSLYIIDMSRDSPGHGLGLLPRLEPQYKEKTMTNMSRNLGVNVYAINPLTNEVIDFFTSYPAESNVFKRKNYLVDSISRGTWAEWSGSARRQQIQTAIDNGWKVGVRLVMLEPGVLLDPVIAQ